MMRALSCALVLLSLVGRLAAQCSAAPDKFAATCRELQDHLHSFESLIQGPRNGAQEAVAFSTELLSANDNRGLNVILSPRTLGGVRRELDGLAKVGVQAVTIAVGFPILYQPFYGFNKDQDDYQKVLGFYKAVMAEVRRRGLKVVIETSVMFPSFARDLPLDAYYATLSETQLTAGRAQVAQTVAEQLRPDWLNLGSEPDTQAALLHMRGGYSARQYGAVISSIVSQLRKAGISGKPLLGAGIGAWQQDGRTYIQALLSTGVDYIDLHIYSANLDFLNRAAKYIDMAQAAGKRSAISEAWLKKLSDAEIRGKSEFGIIRLLNAAKSYDPYSFWAPLDAEFIEDLVKLAYWKNLYFLSPYPSPLLFAYVDYNEARGLGPNEVHAKLIAAAVAAMQSGKLSITGQAYAAAIRSGGAPHPAATRQP